MNRRELHLHLAAAAAWAALPAGARAAPPAARERGEWERIEQLAGGRLGAAVLHADGRLDGHRLDERFPMCSTFKWLAAADVLHRVDRGLERLDRRVRYGSDALLPHSPITQRHVADGLTVGELCHAAVTISDNAAANLILSTLGGPSGLTAYARSLGDRVTRLDRWETQLNEAAPGDPRDTTSPRATVGLLRTCLIGDALSASGREQLGRWLEASQTDGEKLRAGLPPGWRLGSKTGSGRHGSTNDVGIFWPPQRPPVLVAVYITNTSASEADRNAAIAAVAQRVVAAH
jgi:beta-lactamase class A